MGQTDRGKGGEMQTDGWTVTEGVGTGIRGPSKKPPGGPSVRRTFITGIDGHGVVGESPKTEGQIRDTPAVVQRDAHHR